MGIFSKKSIKDLHKELSVLREKIQKARFSSAGSTKDTSSHKKTRQRIARILTELNNRK